MDISGEVAALFGSFLTASSRQSAQPIHSGVAANRHLIGLVNSSINKGPAL
jgi:hypothetical protein